ncbi:hypothetical protein [Candidatus Clostridium stratigraminis]|uniref:DnaD domain-containing protein n=1 Tax=Candidatus Clostridium stratigraminis TaxID=3381661 RepID=A0ABW8T8E0_9CLOT
MNNYIFINKDVFKQLTDDELLIYCYGAFQTKRNEEFIFSSSILNYYLNANTRKQQNEIKTALNGLIAKDLILNVANDVYIIDETKISKAYFVLYHNEFEALKDKKSKLLKYFCFLLSCLNNETQEHKMSNSFIQNGYKELLGNEFISKPTIIKYNDELQKLNLIEVIKGKKINNNCNDINTIKRVTIAEDYKQSLKDKAKTAEAKSKDNSSIVKEIDTLKVSNNSFNKNDLKSRIAEAIEANANDINIFPKQLTKIKDVGEDNFISILKNCISKYPNVLNDQSKNPKERANIFVSCVIKNELEKGIAEIKSREKEIISAKHSDTELQQFTDYMDNIENETQQPNNKKIIDMSSVFEEKSKEQEVKLLWEMEG